MRVIHRFDHGENIVGLVVFQDQLIVATNERIYRLVDDHLERIELVRENRDDGKPNAE